jgi:hypothetical protein
MSSNRWSWGSFWWTERAPEYFATWLSGLRVRLTLQAVVLGGITIAGLGLVDLTLLAEQLGLPVLVATHHNPIHSARGKLYFWTPPGCGWPGRPRIVSISCHCGPLRIGLLPAPGTWAAAGSARVVMSARVRVTSVTAPWDRARSGDRKIRSVELDAVSICTSILACQ